MGRGIWDGWDLCRDRGATGELGGMWDSNGTPNTNYANSRVFNTLSLPGSSLLMGTPCQKGGDKSKEWPGSAKEPENLKVPRPKLHGYLSWFTEELRIQNDLF